MGFYFAPKIIKMPIDKLALIKYNMCKQGNCAFVSLLDWFLALEEKWIKKLD